MSNDELGKQMDEVKWQLKNIKALLMGNGKVGIAEMARRGYEYMLLCKQTKNGLLDWSFRILITLLLGYVAVQIGLKQ